MSKIKIEQIQQEAQSRNWILVSQEYKNLNTEMEFQCPEGHKVLTTYAQWRDRHSCPICDNPKIDLTQKVIQKKKGEVRLLSIDQATHVTGWCIFSNQTVVKYGTIVVDGDTDKRINDTKIWMANMIQMWRPDRVILEDIQLQERKQQVDDGNTVMNVATYKTLAQLQGVLIDYLYENKIPYEIIHTATWRDICQIQGKHRTEKKKSAQLKVKEWFDIDVNNDIADAICIGHAAIQQKKTKVEMLNWS